MIRKATTTTNLKNILFSLRFSRWEFCPGLIPTLATLALLPLLIALGCWQWQRAVFKQNLLDQFAKRSRQAPQALSHDAPNFTPVQVTGYYDTAHLILLDNRIVNHQVGYDVLAPFKPETGETTIIVNLGWMSKNSVSALKNLSEKKQVTLTGLAQRPQHNWVLSNKRPPLSWPLLIEDIRLKELAQILDRPLYPFILLLTSDSGFTHHWDMIVSVTPDRHRAYSVQWFGLALTLLFLYFKLNLRRIS